MTDKARRHQLRDEARLHPPDAGVFLIRHAATGHAIVASAVNLGGARNRFEFAMTTGTPSAIDARLAPDIRDHGLDGVSFEVLEVVVVEPGADDAVLRADLATLEALYREQLGLG